MRTKLTPRDEKLIRVAGDLIRRRRSSISTVACALRTTGGKVYTGVNVEQTHSSACSMCAEYTAIGTMHTDGEAEVETVVALDDEGIILPPCGQCREMIRQFGDPYVLLQKDGERFKMRLGELIPYWDSSDSLRIQR